jgi:outer membrane receptor protein involved in Fe transport
MLAYATNVEVELEDSTNGFANPAGRQSIGGEYQFRVRGLAGSSSVNYVRSTVPVDLFNVERAELASGPNSILFGLGAPAADSVTSWFARGRPITDGPAVAGVITSLGTANRFTFYDQDNKV